MSPRKKAPKKVVINYPPIPTRKWKPPKTEHVAQPFNRKPIQRVPEYPKTEKLHPTTLEKIWHQYRFFHKNAAILLGPFSQNDLRYPQPDRGKQGPANCFVAIGYTRIKEMAKWTSDSIKHILDIGERLFRSSISMSGSKCSCTTPREVHNTFFIEDYQIVLNVDPSTFKCSLATGKFGFISFIKKSFAVAKFFVLEINGSFLAIWRAQGSYYLFDPNDRNSLGLRCKKGQGVATVTKYMTPMILAEDCLANYAPTSSDTIEIGASITPIHINKFEKPELVPPYALQDIVAIIQKKPVQVPVDSCVATKIERKLEKWKPVVPPVPSAPGTASGDRKRQRSLKPPPPERSSNTPSINGLTDMKQIKELMIPTEKPKIKSVTYFKEVIPKKMGILCGRMHQNEPTFSRHFGKQSLANAVSALAMLRQYKSKYWFSKILDEILLTGETIYMESCKNFIGDQILNLDNLSKKFKLNKNYYTPEIEEATAVGRLGSTVPRILDLLPALEEFFSENDQGIIRGPVLLAVWSEEGKYYMFDPNDRDSYGKAIRRKYRLGSTSDQLNSDPGFSCLTWFTDINSLVELYMNNLDNTQKRDFFFISKIEIKNYEEFPGRWNNFIPLRQGKWILRGTFSQNNTRFSPDSRNVQCTAIGTMAVAYTKIKNISLWDRNTVDEVLMEGDVFYNKCVNVLKQKNQFQQKMLMMGEMLDNHTLLDKELIIDIRDCLVNGFLQAPENGDLLNLRKGLEEFFSANEYGVVTSRAISVAIWKESDSFYYFDSHSRDSRGYGDYGGTACVLRLTTIPDLARIVSANLGVGVEDIFNISSIEINVWEKTAEGNVKPEFRAFRELSDRKGILRAKSHQGDQEKFDIYADKQTFTNMIASMALNDIIPSSLWTVDTMEFVLKIGHKLYLDSRIENIKKDLVTKASWVTDEVPIDLDVVNNENVLNEFKIGVNKATVEFGEIKEVVFEPDQINEAEEANGDNAGLPDVRQLLMNALELNEDTDEKVNLIVDSSDISVSIWKKNGLYYVFDPKAKDMEGNFFGRDLWSAKIIIPVIHKIIDEGEGEGEGATDEHRTESSVSLKDSKFQIHRKKSFKKSTQMRRQSKLKSVNKSSAHELLKSHVAPIHFAEQEAEVEAEVEGENEGFGEAVNKMDRYRDLDTSDGKACTLMFTNFRDLNDHILENVPPNKRNNICKIIPVRITTEPNVKVVSNANDKKLGNWYAFQEIDIDRWILRGSIELRNIAFPEINRGKQYGSMCVTACVYARLYAICKYCPQVVDSILKYGDKLHTTVRKLREQELKNNMQELNLSEEEILMIVSGLEICAREAIKQFYLGNYSVQCNVVPAVIEGDVTKEILSYAVAPVIEEPVIPLPVEKPDPKATKRGVVVPKEDPKIIIPVVQEPPAIIDLYQPEKVLSLEAGVTKFFQDNNRFGVLTAKGICVAIWKLDMYYMFDPDSRGPCGVNMLNGTACITRFTSPQKLVDVLKQNLEKDGDNKYTIDRVDIKSSEAKRPQPELSKVISTDPKITAFNEVSPGKMILRGNFHQDHPKFNIRKNAMAAANAIVALAMSHIHKTQTWTKLIVDEVIINSYTLYRQSVEILAYQFNSWEDVMTLNLVNSEFVIGVNVVNWGMQAEDIKQGQLSIKSSTILNLRRGLEDFFMDFNQGVIQSDQLTVAVWLDDDFYFLFDPNSRGSTGLYSSGGRSSLLMFKGIQLLSSHFLANIPVEYHTGEYTITPVEIVVFEKQEAQKKPLKKSEILKVTEIDSLMSEKQTTDKEKGKGKKKHFIKLPAPPCDKEKYSKEKNKKTACYCPDKANVMVQRKEEKVNLIQFSPDKKKEYARKREEEKKRKQLALTETAMRTSFYVLINGDSILRGRYSQNSEIYSVSSRNYQSVQNSLVALVMLKLYDPAKWNGNYIDIVLDSADVLYKDSYTYYRPKDPIIGLANTLRTFYIMKSQIKTTFYKPTISGKCCYDDLNRGLLNFFMSTDMAIIVAKKLAVATFRKAGQYYMFDPHDRDMMGVKCSNGVACLMRFDYLENMVKKYLENCNDEEDTFILWPIKVVGVKTAK